MTSQTTDTILFKGEAYELIGMTQGDLFNPEQFGMNPVMLHTGCYRGYYATYDLTEEGLILRELTIRDDNLLYPIIGGVVPNCEYYLPPDTDPVITKLEDEMNALFDDKLITGSEVSERTKALYKKIRIQTELSPNKKIASASYSGLNEKINFTGKIRIAKDFVNELYIHMGYQKPTSFRTVLDVTLRNKWLAKIQDRSEEMELKRGEFKAYYDSGNMMQTIEDSFSLDMDVE